MSILPVYRKLFVVGITILMMSGCTRSVTPSADNVSASGNASIRTPAVLSPNQDAEPNLDLVEPEALRRRGVKHHPMRRVAQKGRSARLGVQNARRALLAQVKIPIRLGRDPAHQRRRLMDVEIVDDKPPASCGRVTGNDRLHMRQKIGFGAHGTTPGDEHPADHHSTADDSDDL